MFHKYSSVQFSAAGLIAKGLRWNLWNVHWWKDYRPRVVLQILYIILQAHPGTIYANMTLHGKSVLSMTVCLILLVWLLFLCNRKTWKNPEIFLYWVWVRRAWEQEVHGDRIQDHNLWGRLIHWGDLHPSWFARHSTYIMLYLNYHFLDHPCSVLYSYWKVYELLANIQWGLMHLFALSGPKFLFDLFSRKILINPWDLWKLYCQFQQDYSSLNSLSYCLVEWHWWAAY